MYDSQERWVDICEELHMSYRIRPISQAVVALCLFHDEKTPSLFMYPDGNFICLGCGVQGDADEMVERLFGAVATDDAFDLRTAVSQAYTENWLAAARERVADEYARLNDPDYGLPPF